MLRSRDVIAFATTALITAAGCAKPITQVGAVSQRDVRTEQLEQLRMAAELSLANQQRVDRLADPLLKAAAPLCGAPAAKRPPTRRGASALVARSVESCPFQILVQRQDALNAGADGSRIYVSSAMLRFASDEELSVILAHEIAHNAMRHRDAKTKNMLGGALLGAVADIASAAVGVNTRGQYSDLGAKAGAQAFSQDFEREADYIAMYILAWAGRPTTQAAQFWRRIAVESPSEIVFGTTHPTTAERFVRLEQWNGEVGRKLASGAAFGPEMRDQRRRVVSVARSVPTNGSAGGEVVAAALRKSDSPALGVDAGPRAALAPSPVAREPVAKVLVEPQPSSARALTTSTATSTATIAADDERFARATIGAPRSDADRMAAIPAYELGKQYLGSHDWTRAKKQFRLALQLDGSVAAYHAALGEVLLVEQDWAGAAAEYTAALLIDVDNKEYRERLKEARSRR